MKFGRYLLVGFIVVIVVIGAGLIFPSTERVADTLMKPGGLLLTGLPGGMHSPLNLLLAVAAQTVVYAGTLLSIHVIWKTVRQSEV